MPEEAKDSKAEVVSDSKGAADRNPAIMKNFTEFFGDAYKAPAAGQPVAEKTPDINTSKEEVVKEESKVLDETTPVTPDNSISEYEERIAAYEKRMAELEEKISFTVKEKETPAVDEPQMPTQAEAEADPIKAAEKVFEYKQFQAEKKRNQEQAKREKSDREKSEKEFSKKYWADQAAKKNNIWKELTEENPSLKDKNSALFKEADRILTEEIKKDPAFKLNPNCDEIAVNRAVRNLNKAKGETSKASQLNNGTLIMQPSRGAGDPKRDLTPEEFDRLPQKEREAIMRESYFRRGQT